MSGKGSQSKDLRSLHLWQIQGVRDIVVVAAVLAMVWTGYAMRTVTVPLLVAFGLAYLVEPVVQWLTHKGRMRRQMAVTLILGVAGVVVTVGLTFALPIVVAQTTSFVQTVRRERLDAIIGRIQEVVPAEYKDQVGRLGTWVKENISPAPLQRPAPPAMDDAPSDADGAPNAPGTTGVPGAPGTAAPGAAGAAPGGAPAGPPAPGTPTPAPGANGSAAALHPAEPAGALDPEAIRTLVNEELDRRGLTAASAAAGAERQIPFASFLGSGVEQVMLKALDVITLLFLAFLVPFYFWFFSVSFPDAVRFLGAMVPERSRPRVLSLVRDMDRAVSGFVRGRIVIAFFMGVMAALGWKYCGVPYAITLGLAAGVLSIVPYLGFAAVPIAVGLLLLDQMSLPAPERMTWYWIFLGPTLVFVVVQSVEGYLLTPLIAGKATDLGPVSIFVAVLAGASIAGVYGMLLSIPAAACLKIWWREVLLPRIRDWSAGRSADPLPLENE